MHLVRYSIPLSALTMSTRLIRRPRRMVVSSEKKTAIKDAMPMLAKPICAEYSSLAVENGLIANEGVGGV